MATDLQTPPEQNTVTGVLAGIVDDFQKLMQQQMDMVRAEIRSDWDRTKQAIMPIGIGAGLLLIGGLLLSLMLVHLVHWGSGHPDAAGIPLWGAYGLIGGGFLVIGAVFLSIGLRLFNSFNPLPDKAADALKENVKWLTNNR